MDTNKQTANKQTTNTIQPNTLQHNILHEETDLYNITMDNIGPEETKNTYSVWQAVPRDVNKYFKPRVMAGGRAILREYQKFYPNAGLEFCILQDGMPFLPGDPVIQVIGDKSIARKLEPKILSTLFYMTEIATRTKELVDEFGADRIIEVGMRGQAPGSWTFSGEAYLMGGGKLTSNTSLRNVPELVEGRDYNLVGTTGHSLYLEYMAAGYTQKDAFREILQKFEKAYPGKPCSLLVDTVDPMLGITQALDVIREQKKISGQTHYIRLDSGDLLSQAIYSLRDMISTMPDFKVIIEDGLNRDKMKNYDASIRLAGFNAKKNASYGLGGYFSNNITRDDNGAWAYKPSMIRTTNNGDVNVLKTSGNPLKQSMPGLIGIGYDVFGSRLNVHSMYSVNKILDADGQAAYLNKSIDELLTEAKPFWDRIGNMPDRWTQCYDMSDELKAIQHEAVKQTHDFGYKSEIMTDYGKGKSGMKGELKVVA
jgi:nicotinic acid phosphoribosyltransferase